MDSEIGKISSLFVGRAKHHGRDREKLCVILGAGADISSGGMTFSQVKRACLERFEETSAASFWSDEELESRFNRFLEMNDSEAQRSAIIDFIFHGFESGVPSDGYKILVLMAKEGLVDSIITTNFDDLLEIAQRELNLDVFQIYAPGMASPFLIGDRIHLPPKPIYVKVHGDIRSQFISHITKKDIQDKIYDHNFSLLLRLIFSTHRLIIVGYSGGDEIFAKEIEAVSESVLQPVYWCNKVPLDKDSPLGRALQNADLRFVRAGFEQIFTEGCVSCLNGALEASVQFVAPLVGEKLRKVNEEFLEAFPYSKGADRLALLIPRKTVAPKLATFRANPKKTLAVLSGASGVGKSTVLAQLCDAAAAQRMPTFVAIRSRSLASTDVARGIIERLGYTSENPLALLYQFSGWLKQRGDQLTIAVDALNEFSPSTDDYLWLFKEILRVSLWLQYHGVIKILVTIRPESWNEVYSNVDHYDLKKVLWTDAPDEDKISAIHLGRFSQDEFPLAYNAYSRHYDVTTAVRQVDAASRELLCDPYFLALTMKSRETIVSYALGYDIYRQAHKDLLQRSFGHQRAQEVDVALARLASLCLDKCVTEFSTDLLAEVGLSQANVSVLQEINILSRISPATLCFSHDRVHESYLVVAINELSAVSILSVEDLPATLERAKSYPRLYSALRQCFSQPPQNLEEHYTHLLFEIMSSCFSPSSIHPPQRRNLLYEFAKDTVMSIAANTPDRFCLIGQSFFSKSMESGQEPITRVLLHACCLLTVERFTPVVLPLVNSESPLLRAEAFILLYDKIVHRVLSEPQKAGTEIAEGLFQGFFFGEQVDPFRQVLRVLGLVSQIGRDNSHPEEWKAIAEAIGKAFNRACAETTQADFPDDISKMVLHNANRYLFNAGEDVGNDYFCSQHRNVFDDILRELDAGSPVRFEHVVALRPFICHLGQTIEFVLSNLLIVISFKHDRQATLNTLAQYFSTFDEYTNPEEFDFFLSVLCLGCLCLGEPFQEIAAEYTEKMLSQYPHAVLLNPGATRGQRRGRFTDPFDQQFEDGFNLIAFYFYNAPALRRQALSYVDYLKSSTHDEDLLPLYWEYLNQFEARNQPVGILRIIHALGQMISLWPIEGLLSLQRLLGRTEPTVRRAIIRVLAEAYARFPGETMLLMAQSGSAFTEEEKFSIKYSVDPRLSERSFEQLQWSRIIIFLDQMDSGGKFINDITGLLARSTTFTEALEGIFRRVISISNSRAA